jgi:hypothetical protein
MATTTSAAPVDTGKVSGRRRLHFDNVQDIMADVDALAARSYRQLGNWSLGQMCKHLTIAMQMPLDGSSIKVPWFIRLAARMFFLPKLLREGMKPGFKLSPAAAKSLVPDRTADADGVAQLRAAVARFQKEPLVHPHPFFGKLTPEEWTTVALRHAELHLGFLLPN